MHINHFFHDFQTLYNLIQLGFLGMFCVLKIDWKRLKDFKEWYLTCYIDHIQRWFNKIDKKWRNMKWRKLLNIDFTTQLKFLFKNQLETNGSQVNITKTKLVIHFEVDFLLNWKTWNLNGLRTFGTHFFWRENLPFFFHFCHFLKKYSVFEAPICGRRPPEHPIKFFGLTKCIFVQLMCWNYMRIYFLHTPGQFLSDTSDFSSFLGNGNFFGRPRAAGDPPEVPQNFLTGPILLLNIHL